MILRNVTAVVAKIVMIMKQTANDQKSVLKQHMIMERRLRSSFKPRENMVGVNMVLA